MELQPGWYKVKLNGKWVCAKWGGTHWEYLDFRIMHEDFDQIGDRIEFPEENQVYDFYFSKKHKDQLLMHSSLGYIGSGVRSFINTVNGIEYTEMIKKGKTPATNSFGDLVLVYSGSDYEIGIRK